MKTVSVVVPKGQYSIVNIAGAFQILNWASDAYRQCAGRPLFQVDLVGGSRPSRDAEGLYAISPTKTFQDVQETDLIILPAVHGELEEAIQVNRDTIHWVMEQHRNGAEIAAFCVGTFLLAKTGLLRGKTCSTHWGHARDLQDMFPEVRVQSEKIVTDCEGLYTSGGAYAFTNLLVYLVEKYGGRELAVMTAKAFMINMDKADQSIFSIFNGQKDHRDELILKIQDQIEKTYRQKISIGELATRNHTNRRTLERRFRAATGNSILEYHKRVRIEAAKKVLEQPRNKVADAMYESGYNDPKAFRGVFKKIVGISPSDYRKKFQQIGVAG